MIAPSVMIFRASRKIKQKDDHTLLTQVSHTAHNILASKYIEKITHAQLKDDFLLKHMQILSKIDQENKKISSTKHNNISVLYETKCFTVPRVLVNQHTKHKFRNQVFQNSKGDILGSI